MYAVLGVLPEASEDEIRSAYHRKLRFDDVETPEGTARNRQLREAYEVLSDPDRRRSYDATRYGWNSQPVTIEDDDRRRAPVVEPAPFAEETEPEPHPDDDHRPHLEPGHPGHTRPSPRLADRDRLGGDDRRCGRDRARDQGVDRSTRTAFRPPRWSRPSTAPGPAPVARPASRTASSRTDSSTTSAIRTGATSSSSRPRRWRRRSAVPVGLSSSG